MAVYTGGKEEAIAIIGMACVFPQAADLTSYWNNIINSVCAIGEPLPEWDANRYLKSGRINTSKGGYLKDLFSFNPADFGIMPKSVDGGEPDHYLALRVAREALVDAGYADASADHTDTGIILGHSTYLHRGQGNHIQHHIILDQTLELLQSVFPNLDAGKSDEIRQLLRAKLPQCGTDIAPALVPNVMTGRIANRLNLKGPNYLIDAACSSSLLAVNAAIEELRSGKSRMMLAGGVNASLPAEVSVIFTELGALSPKGRIRPFDKDCDGTLLGEGLGVVALKRVSDAIADHDRIYAVIHAVGQASDGKGHGLLAPSVDGEALAINRAYTSSGIEPSSIDLIEAHGTGIPLGDKTEISAIRKIFGERQGTQGSVAIGSIKSMISHCIPAAGIAGLIKSALALHHKILPPTLCDQINPNLGIESTPLYVNTQPRPWITTPERPRRAGINSFGFGGINTHAILEEAPPQAAQPAGLTSLPCSLCVFTADNIENLVARLKQTAEILNNLQQERIAKIAAALHFEARDLPCRLAIVAKSPEELLKKIKQALSRFAKSGDNRWTTRNGIVFSNQPLPGKVAFMFPGEGSQYLEMFRELAMYFDDVRSWFDFWKGLYNDAPGASRTDIVFPPVSELTDERREQLESRLHDMDVGSEAAFIGGQAMHALLSYFQVRADVMVGHSTGESSALAASRAIGSGDRRQLAEFIRELNSVYSEALEAGDIATGALLTVGAMPQEQLLQHMAQAGDDIVIAMDNCANQKVLFGPVEAINNIQDVLVKAGGICALLPFDRGYHTPLFANISTVFRAYYESVQLKTPETPLYSCASAGLFPDDSTAACDLAAAQWSRQVRFSETVNRMHDDGVRYFVEVGPSGNLSAFVNDILTAKDHLTLPTNLRRKDSLEQLLLVLAQLFVNEKPVDLQRLFAYLPSSRLELRNLGKKVHRGISLNNTMPMIRLDSRDVDTLRQLLSSDVGTVWPQYSEHPDSVSSQESVAVQEIPGTGDDNREQQVMLNHFELMHSLLNQQNELMRSIVTEGYEGTREGHRAHPHAPMLTAVSELDESHCSALCLLSVFEDNFLQDHILSGQVSAADPDLTGLACVPFMVSLEIMAEACALIAGSRDIKTIENIQAFEWIALDDNQLVLDVDAEVVASTRGEIYRAHIHNDGRKVVTAEFSFRQYPDPEKPALAPLQEINTYRWRDEELYSTGMFHGPIFQSIKAIVGWDATGIDARLSRVSLEGFLTDGDTPELVLNPVLLDAVGQLAAYWIAQQVGTDFNSFPSSVERIELFENCPQNLEGMKLSARQQPLDPRLDNPESQKKWHFICHDHHGRPLLSVTNLVNIFFRVPNRFYEFRRAPLNGQLGRQLQEWEDGGELLWSLPHLPSEFCAQSGSIFLRILAHALLSFEELETWRGMRDKNIRQQRQWLLGRACIKEAVRFWILQQTGQLVFPADIEVYHDEFGAPYVGGWWQDELLAAPEVSLSHDQHGSLAGVVAAEKAIGVDAEHIHRDMNTDLILHSLHQNERAILHGLQGPEIKETALRLICAKEAAAKFLGSGLKGQPENFRVQLDNNSWEQASVVHDENVIGVKVRKINDTVIAVATGHMW